MQKEMAKPGKYLTFILAKQSFGIPINSIREINRVSDITAIPQTADYVVGVINLRGKVIPVIDLRSRFDLQANSYDKETCIVVIEGQKGQVGAVVDTVKEVTELALDNIEAPPAVGNGMHNTCINGIGKLTNNVLLLVNIDEVLNDEELNGVMQHHAQADVRKDEAAPKAA